MTFEEAQKGQRVRHGILGFEARVIRPVKSRRVVTIQFTTGPRAGGDWYDAYAENLTVIVEA